MGIIDESVTQQEKNENGSGNFIFIHTSNKGFKLCSKALNSTRGALLSSISKNLYNVFFLQNVADGKLVFRTLINVEPIIRFDLFFE